MYTRNSVLTEKLRRLSDGLRGVCDGAGIKDHTCSELLDEAAAEIERLQKDVDRYAETSFAHVREKNVLFDRLSHLLQSKTICTLDAKDEKTGEYLRDIHELDAWITGLENIARDHGALTGKPAAAAEKTQAADQEATDSEKENVEQEETQAADGTLVLYVCDRLACAKCNINCSHTTDVRHALRFNGYNFLFDVVVREAAEHADDR